VTRAPRTLAEKLWTAHEVAPARDDRPPLLYVDLHLLHEVTSPQAFALLEERGLGVRRPELTLATIDHATPTVPPGPDGRRAWASPATEAQAALLECHARAHGIRFEGWDSPHRGIVHVMAPELGLTRPGMSIACGDSHTGTHGAFAALAFGIGTTEVAHVLATQTLILAKPKTMAVTVTGRLAPGVTAKDLALALIARIGTAGAVGHIVEYRGEAIEALDMEARMTLCNMSVEAGARTGLIGADETTVAWLRGRPEIPAAVPDEVPGGDAFEAAARNWRHWRSDPGAAFDAEVTMDAATVRPMITWGTTPAEAVAVDAPVPATAARESAAALSYMGVAAGKPLTGVGVDLVFLGSCTNARLSDLRAAAAILSGRRVAQGTRMLVVPGSSAVKRAAEAEGLDRVFTAAGAEWREPGCSLCLALNGDTGKPGELIVSTSNRNFEGRQGRGARTVLASPETAAAAAISGRIVDPRHIVRDGKAAR
jgi:3-isopropylmalate/(R)-2-methylmalate dehydratase large subunit